MNTREANCRCGSSIEPFELCIDTDVATLEILCKACLAEARSGYARLQQDFRALIDRGVHPKIADRIMCVRIDNGLYLPSEVADVLQG